MVDGGAELIRAAEHADDFVHVAAAGDGWDFQDVGKRKLHLAVVGVFLQQVVQDFASSGRVVGEEGGLLVFDPVGALATGENGRVEGQVTEEIGRVGVGFADLGGDRLEIDAALRQLLDNLDALGSVGPPGAEVFKAGAEGSDFFGSVIREFDDPELLAVGVEFVDQFGSDFDLAAVEIEFAAT